MPRGRLVGVGKLSPELLEDLGSGPHLVYAVDEDTAREMAPSLYQDADLPTAGEFPAVFFMSTVDPPPGSGLWILSREDDGIVLKADGQVMGTHLDPKLADWLVDRAQIATWDEPTPLHRQRCEICKKPIVKGDAPSKINLPENKTAMVHRDCLASPHA